MKKMIIALALTVSVGSNFFSNSIFNVMAEEEIPQTCRYYKSIQLTQGDSLWSIAKEYTEGTDISIESYMLLLKQMNGLREDTIHAGRYLTVMYLAEAE